ncbi:MAG TPA: hypothetical protein VIM56_13705 [Rhizomicrobium sp.]
MATLGYATVGSNDLARAKAFYTALLEPFGITKLFPHPTGGQIYGKDGAFVFGVIGAYDKKPATVGNGTMISFRCDSTQEVMTFMPRRWRLAGKTKVRRASAHRNST